MLEDRQADILRECGNRFLIYTRASKQIRRHSSRLIQEQYQIAELNLEEKYFHLWRSKCQKTKRFVLTQPTKLPLKIPSVSLFKPIEEKTSNFSLEKRENLTNEIVNPQLLSVNKRAERPAPRKPTHLLQSIDMKSDLIVQSPTKVNFYQPTSLIKDSTKTVLLPPSAFCSSSTENASVLGQPLESFDVNLPETRLGFDLTVNQTTENKVKCAETVDFELIDLKKRLENFSMKSEKLK